MRESLLRFAVEQERVLKENDYKGGWDNCSTVWLWRRALDEMIELFISINGNSKDEILQECCDVANFMMMIADNEVLDESISP